MVVPIGERALEVERTAARVLVLLRTFRFPAPSPPLWGERAGVRGRSLSTPSSFTQPLTETFFQQRLPIDHEKPPHPNPLPRSGGEGTRQPNVRSRISRGSRENVFAARQLRRGPATSADPRIATRRHREHCHEIMGPCAIRAQRSADCGVTPPMVSRTSPSEIFAAAKTASNGVSSSFKPFKCRAATELSRLRQRAT